MTQMTKVQLILMPQCSGEMIELHLKKKFVKRCARVKKCDEKKYKTQIISFESHFIRDEGVYLARHNLEMKSISCGTFLVVRFLLVTTFYYALVLAKWIFLDFHTQGQCVRREI
mmetsp:Transcript_30559/g.29470  ORF Transcript_30559/g.29470 Transcript_30559/m.29470 type:complete len:114 (+) Transcript_30559:546-887(+)